MRCFRARGAIMTASGLALMLLGGTVLTTSGMCGGPGRPRHATPAATFQVQPAATPVERLRRRPVRCCRASRAYVGRILVQGNERIDPETILSYLPINCRRVG